MIDWCSLSEPPDEPPEQSRKALYINGFQTLEILDEPTNEPPDEPPDEPAGEPQANHKTRSILFNKNERKKKK